MLVVGDNDTSENFIRLTKIEKNSPYNVVGIVGTKKSGIGRRIHNIPIISSVDELDDLKIKIKNLDLQRVIISDNTIDSNLIESLYIFSKKMVWQSEFFQSYQTFHLTLRLNLLQTRLLLRMF